jgi:hypothetical protein
MLDDSETLVPFGEGIWLAAAPVSFLGMRLTATMTVVRLPDGGLLLHSPVSMTPARREQVEALGPVRHLCVPNLFHHGWVAEWAAACPAARLHAPPGLARKRPDLRIDRTHGEAPEPAFAGTIDELPIAGFRVRETALLVRPARTAIVADLVHNVGRPAHAWTAAYTRLMGFYDRVALSRMIRWTGLSDKAAARRALDHLLAQDFDRLVVGHGAPLSSGAKPALAAAYAWLGA